MNGEKLADIMDDGGTRATHDDPELLKQVISVEHDMLLQLMKAIQEHVPEVYSDRCECCGETQTWTCSDLKCRFEGYSGAKFSQHILDIGTKKNK